MTLLAVAILHGMGEPARGYSRRFQAELRRRLRKAEAAAEPVFAEIFWADVLSAKERELLRRLEKHNRLDYGRLRRFVVQALGDGVAYQLTHSEDLSPGEVDVYAEVHDRVAEALEDLAARAGGHAPLAWIAHSLGSVVASNYIWDSQKARYRSAARSPLARCKTLHHLFFLGSPLALWSLRYRTFGKPIAWPVANPQGLWLGFYDPDDVLGYPLRTINAQYLRRVSADIEVNVGGPMTSWNPLSHLRYWEDDDVLDGIARALAG